MSGKCGEDQQPATQRRGEEKIDATGKSGERREGLLRRSEILNLYRGKFEFFRPVSGAKKAQSFLPVLRSPMAEGAGFDSEKAVLRRQQAKILELLTGPFFCDSYASAFSAFQPLER